MVHERQPEERVEVAELETRGAVLVLWDLAGEEGRAVVDILGRRRVGLVV